MTSVLLRQASVWSLLCASFSWDLECLQEVNACPCVPLAPPRFHVSPFLGSPASGWHPVSGPLGTDCVVLSGLTMCIEVAGLYIRWLPASLYCNSFLSVSAEVGNMRLMDETDSI